MASGQSKQSAVNSATNKAVAASAPKSYSDPNGSFNGQTGVFSPNQSDASKATAGTLDQGINNYAGQVANFNLDPFQSDVYKNSLNQLQSGVNRQYGQDQLSLQNKLNAQGLTGGSFDAYSNSLLNQNHDYNLLQQQAPALQAYQQNYANALGGLQGLGQAQTQQTAQYYQPFDNYVRYQGAVNPSSTTAASAYANQANLAANKTTSLDNILKLYGVGQQTAGTLAAAAL